MTEEYKGAIGIIAKNILKKSVEILGKKDSDPTPNPLVKLEECVKKLSRKDPQLMVEPDDSFQVINCLKDLTKVLVELSLRSSKNEKQIQYLQREVQEFGEREKELMESVKSLWTQVNLNNVVLACRKNEDGVYEQIDVYSLTSQFIDTVKRELCFTRQKTQDNRMTFCNGNLLYCDENLSVVSINYESI